jgi:hypothetical protein
METVPQSRPTQRSRVAVLQTAPQLLHRLEEGLGAKIATTHHRRETMSGSGDPRPPATPTIPIPPRLPADRPAPTSFPGPGIPSKRGDEK